MALFYLIVDKTQNINRRPLFKKPSKYHQDIVIINSILSGWLWQSKMSISI